MSPAAVDSVLNQIDMGQLEQFQIEASYGKLYPLIMKDFRELGDCCGIHKPQNMMVTGNAGPFPLSGAFVTMYVVSNPTSPTYHPLADAKQAEYKGKVAAGESAVSALESMI